MRSETTLQTGWDNLSPNAGGQNPLRPPPPVVPPLPSTTAGWIGMRRV